LVEERRRLSGRLPEFRHLIVKSDFNPQSEIRNPQSEI